jgi:peptidoglycan/LPS O-acetylase OafA/YrhL
VSDDLSPRDAPEPEATRTGRAAVHALSLTLLGACTALMLATLSDAVLLPEVDRTPPRALGFFVVGSFLALGWWLSLRRAQAVDGSSVMLYGGGLLVGAGVSLASLDPLHGCRTR